MWIRTLTLASPPSPAAVRLSSSYLVPSLVLQAANWDGRGQDLAGCFPRAEDLGLVWLIYFVVVDPRVSHMLGRWSTTEALGYTSSQVLCDPRCP